MDKHKKEIDELTKKYNRSIIKLKMNQPAPYSPETHKILVDKRYAKYDLKWYLLTMITEEEKNSRNKGTRKKRRENWRNKRTRKEKQNEDEEGLYENEESYESVEDNEIEEENNEEDLKGEIKLKQKEPKKEKEDKNKIKVTLWDEKKN